VTNKLAPFLEELWWYAQGNDDYKSYVSFYAQIDDDLLGNHYSEMWDSDYKKKAYFAEVAKRRKAQDQDREQQQIAQERAAAATKRKDALQFSDALASEICERISAGELLTVICLDQHLPTVRRCNMWLRQRPEFAALYEQPLQDRLAIFEEQLIQIPDEAARDFDVVTKGNNSKRVLDPAKVTMAKLRVEVRRLHLKAGRPQKWGDTSTLITRSEDPFDPSNLSAEELERRISEIEQKDRIVKANKVA
jgi:hypothetical protein